MEPQSVSGGVCAAYAVRSQQWPSIVRPSLRSSVMRKREFPALPDRHGLFPFRLSCGPRCGLGKHVGSVLIGCLPFPLSVLTVL